MSKRPCLKPQAAFQQPAFHCDWFDCLPLVFSFLARRDQDGSRCVSQGFSQVLSVPALFYKRLNKTTGHDEYNYNWKYDLEHCDKQHLKEVEVWNMEETDFKHCSSLEKVIFRIHDNPLWIGSQWPVCFRDDIPYFLVEERDISTRHYVPSLAVFSRHVTHGILSRCYDNFPVLDFRKEAFPRLQELDVEAVELESLDDFFCMPSLRRLTLRDVLLSDQAIQQLSELKHVEVHLVYTEKRIHGAFEKHRDFVDNVKKMHRKKCTLKPLGIKLDLPDLTGLAIEELFAFLEANGELTDSYWRASSWGRVNE